MQSKNIHIQSFEYRPVSPLGPLKESLSPCYSYSYTNIISCVNFMMHESAYLNKHYYSLSLLHFDCVVGGYKTFLIFEANFRTHCFICHASPSN